MHLQISAGQSLTLTDQSTMVGTMETSNDTRQRIISAAQELIYARSYNEVGVQEICDRAEVKKGSFYHFFPSKRDLALAVLDQSQAFMYETIINKAFAADIPPLARIERFFTTIYDFHKQAKQETGFVFGCPFGNLGCEMSTQDEDIRSRIDEIFQASEKPFAAALTEAVANGDLPAIDTAATAKAIFAYVEGIMVYAKTSNDPELIRELGKHALKLAIPANMQ
jgi:TetR/AcrR family transcriptional repressor of nem operon